MKTATRKTERQELLENRLDGDLNGEQGKEKQVHLHIPPPNMKIAKFMIRGIAPLVVHRMSMKTQKSFVEKMVTGSTPKKGKQRAPVNLKELFNEARYISKEGWDGFNATAIRCAMISACRLVDYKMTLAKLSIFVIPDGVDAKEPQYQLVRIIGTPRPLEMWARVETGQPYITVRPCYDKWRAEVKIRYDADQFRKIEDVANLLARAGAQVGICEGRPDSKKSTGMGWGLFEIEGKDAGDGKV